MVSNFGFGSPFAVQEPLMSGQPVTPMDKLFANYKTMTPEELQAAQQGAMGDLQSKQFGLSQGFADRVSQIAPDMQVPGNGEYDLAQQSAGDQWADYQKRMQDQSAAFGGYMTGMQQDQTRQQQAYQSQQGGSAQGGMMPANYSTPFSGQVTGMPNNQPWGTPGFGGPGNTGSIDQYNMGGLGGLGGMKTNSPWGGPFGAKNPFSPT